MHVIPASFHYALQNTLRSHLWNGQAGPSQQRVRGSPGEKDDPHRSFSSVKALHLQETKTGSSSCQAFLKACCKSRITFVFISIPNSDVLKCNFPNVISRSSHARLRRLKCASAGWNKYSQRGTVYTKIFGVMRCHVKRYNSELKGVKVWPDAWYCHLCILYRWMALWNVTQSSWWGRAWFNLLYRGIRES